MSSEEPFGTNGDNQVASGPPSCTGAGTPTGAPPPVGISSEPGISIARRPAVVQRSSAALAPGSPDFLRRHDARCAALDEGQADLVAEAESRRATYTAPPDLTPVALARKSVSILHRLGVLLQSTSAGSKPSKRLWHCLLCKTHTILKCSNNTSAATTHLRLCHGVSYPRGVRPPNTASGSGRLNDSNSPASGPTGAPAGGADPSLESSAFGTGAVGNLKREAEIAGAGWVERGRKRGRAGGAGGTAAAGESCAAALVWTGAVKVEMLREAQVARALGLSGGGYMERILERVDMHYARVRSSIIAEVGAAATIRGVPNVHLGIAVFSAAEATRLLSVRACFLSPECVPRNVLLYVAPMDVDDSGLGTVVSKVMRDAAICAEAHVASVTLAGISGELRDSSGKKVFADSIPTQHCFLELVDAALGRAFRVGTCGFAEERKWLSAVVAILRHTQRLRVGSESSRVSAGELDAVERLEAGLEDGADRWMRVSSALDTVLGNWRAAVSELSARGVDTGWMSNSWVALQHMHALLSPFRELVAVLQKGGGTAVEAALTLASFRASILRRDVALSVQGARKVPHHELDTATRLVRESLEESIRQSAHATSESCVVACVLHPALKALRYLDAAMGSSSEMAAAAARENAWRKVRARVERAMSGEEHAGARMAANGPEAKFAALGFADIAGGERAVAGASRETGDDGGAGAAGAAKGGSVDAGEQAVADYRAMRAEKLTDVMVGGAGAWWRALAHDAEMHSAMEALCGVGHAAAGTPASAYCARMGRAWGESGGARRGGMLVALGAWQASRCK